MKEPEYIQGKGYIAEVVRTARVKSVTIKVEDGAVSVVVPRELLCERISKLLSDKSSWIKQKLQQQREAQPVSAKQFVSGEAFSYLGRNYRLKVECGPFAPIKLVEGRLTAVLPDGVPHAYMLRNALIRWYKHQAESKLKQKVKRYAEVIGVQPAAVGIKTFKNRWGSCNASGRIDFNWRIVMAPNRIVDYVVVHELCHLKQHDHSPKFWKAVETVMPDYAECKAWLRENAGRLEV